MNVSSIFGFILFIAASTASGQTCRQAFVLEQRALVPVRATEANLVREPTYRPFRESSDRNNPFWALQGMRTAGDRLPPEERLHIFRTILANPHILPGLRALAIHAPGSWGRLGGHPDPSKKPTLENMRDRHVSYFQHSFRLMTESFIERLDILLKEHPLAQENHFLISSSTAQSRDPLPEPIAEMNASEEVRQFWRWVRRDPTNPELSEHRSEFVRYMLAQTMPYILKHHPREKLLNLYMDRQPGMLAQLTQSVRRIFRSHHADFIQIESAKGQLGQLENSLNGTRRLINTLRAPPPVITTDVVEPKVEGIRNEIAPLNLRARVDDFNPLSLKAEEEISRISADIVHAATVATSALRDQSAQMTHLREVSERIYNRIAQHKAQPDAGPMDSPAESRRIMEHERNSKTLNSDIEAITIEVNSIIELVERLIPSIEAQGQNATTAAEIDSLKFVVSLARQRLPELAEQNRETLKQISSRARESQTLLMF